MRRFAKLFEEIDSTTKTSLKVNALANYFREAPEQDQLWTIALFSHKRPKRTISTTLLREWIAEESGVPSWLFEESYHIVGDLAETISLLLTPTGSGSDKSLSDWISLIQEQKDREESEKKAFVLNAWNQLSQPEIFLFNKIITGGFRIGVSQKLIAKGLSKALEKTDAEIAHRLMGNWTPDTISYEELLLSDDINADDSKPYPFYLAYALEGEPGDLGKTDQWSAEYKWDGIRSQLIKRNGQVFLWSRGEELVTESYPEVHPLAAMDTSDFVIDGELVVYRDDEVQAFNDLQKRLGRKKVSKKMLASHPCAIIAYDLLELNGQDLRLQPLSVRREELERLISQINSQAGDYTVLHYSPSIDFNHWQDLVNIRSKSRDKRAEGLMLKLKDGIYKDGRKKGEWWKWKVDPFTIDAVMLYAQRGHGRRSNLFTDFTFAVWDNDKLVPFTKAYSGLTDKEFGEVTRFVKSNTIERFGPVRSVNPELVFEIAFEGINESKRHKSGVALRFPRIKRWRRDKSASEADTLDTLKLLLEA